MRRGGCLTNLLVAVRPTCNLAANKARARSFAKPPIRAESVPGWKTPVPPRTAGAFHGSQLLLTEMSSARGNNKFLTSRCNCYLCTKRGTAAADNAKRDQGLCTAL